MIQIGITGGIACGKSTILERIRSLGHEVFSADDAFREIFNTDAVQNWLKAEITQRKGESVYEDYLKLGKTLLRYLIVSDADFKRDYEALVHPMVRQAMLTSGAQIAEVPLMFEIGAETLFNHVWVIACDPETQIQRLMERESFSNHDREYAIAWISHQMPLKDKIQRANRVIYTDVSLQEVFDIVDCALKEDLYA